MKENKKFNLRELTISGLFILVLAGLFMFFALSGDTGITNGSAPATGIAHQSANMESSPIYSTNTRSIETIVKSSAPIQNPVSISVYVVGSVASPGVYTLPKGCLIFDAVGAAGGITSSADPTSVNMAYVLTENVMIWVKPIGGQSTGTGGVIADGTGIVPDASSEGGSDGIVMVNINTADAATLATLPGIGPATAADILGYRAKSGDFGKIEDIMKVPGIKDSKYQKIKDFICV